MKNTLLIATLTIAFGTTAYAAPAEGGSPRSFDATIKQLAELETVAGGFEGGESLLASSSGNYSENLAKLLAAPVTISRVYRNGVADSSFTDAVFGSVMGLYYRRTSGGLNANESAQISSATIVKSEFLQIAQNQQMIEQNARLEKQNARIITLLEKIAAKK